MKMSFNFLRLWSTEEAIRILRTQIVFNFLHYTDFACTQAESLFTREQKLHPSKLIYRIYLKNVNMFCLLFRV